MKARKRILALTSASFESARSRLYGGKSKPCSRQGQGHSASQERMARNQDEAPSLNSVFPPLHASNQSTSSHANITSREQLAIERQPLNPDQDSND
jgi:hypothetical protein